MTCLDGDADASLHFEDGSHMWARPPDCDLTVEEWERLLIEHVSEHGHRKKVARDRMAGIAAAEQAGII